MNSVTELERYRILAGVHMWHLEHGEQKRDWEKIGDYAEVVKQKSVVKNTFKKLSKPTDVWFPYPVILDKDLSDPLKRSALFGMEPDEVDGGHAQRPWDQIVGDVLSAALVVDPWVMQLRQVKHFLGFIDDALHPEKMLGRYDTALEYAKKQLPPGKYELYAGYNAAADVGVQRSDYEIRLELNRLIDLFREVKHPHVLPLKLEDGVQSLTDVSYYRRPMYDTIGDVEMMVRRVLSDYEMMEFFKGVLQHNFDTSSNEDDDWRKFLSLMDIEWMLWQDVKTDFYRIFLPRFELLKTHLAPNLNCRGFEFEDDLLNVYRVIYHSCKERTFFEVLRTITVLQSYGWLDLDLVGGVGPHYASFKFIIMVLNVGAFAFDTPRNEHIRAQSQFISDLHQNYRRFIYRLE